MIARELVYHFNNTFGKTKPWPETFEVDSETYADVCQFVFNSMIENSTRLGSGHVVSVVLGSNGGIMFKNVELLLKRI